MYRMTKAMWKDNDRIEAWLRGEEFKENARAKPAVPDLTVEDVLDTWTPPDVTGAGQFFTPCEAASELWRIGYPGNLPDGARVLDPCAGIGHLLYAARHEWWFEAIQSPADEHDYPTVDAYELESACVDLGSKLFPSVNWFHSIPFDELDAITGAYDLVLMNPPFGTTRGMYGGRDEMCSGKVSRSEHIFLWLMTLALKKGGIGMVILPYNTWDKIPKTAKPWFEDRLILENTWGPLPGALPGEFRHSTSMKVHGYIFRRTEYDVLQSPQVTGEAIADVVTSSEPVPADSGQSGDEAAPGSLLDPEQPRSVTVGSDGMVTIAVEEDDEDDGAVTVGYMDGEVMLRVRPGSDVPKPGEIGVEPVAIRDVGGIRGYLPMVKQGGKIQTVALSRNAYASNQELEAWLRSTPEEAMNLWRSGEFIIHNDVQIWSQGSEMWRAFVCVPREEVAT